MGSAPVKYIIFARKTAKCVIALIRDESDSMVLAVRKHQSKILTKAASTIALRDSRTAKLSDFKLLVVELKA